MGNRRLEDSFPDLFLEPIIAMDNFWNYDLNLKAARIAAWSLRLPGNKRRLPCTFVAEPSRHSPLGFTLSADVSSVFG